MTIHNLKTWPEFFLSVWDGTKPFEYRKNDRDYKVKDILLLEEWDPTVEKYTGRKIFAEVTYVLTGEMGVAKGYAILAIKIKTRISEYLDSLQSPKKLIGRSDFNTCPTCGSEFVEMVSESGFSSKKFNYCGNCSQKLDWRG